MTNEEYRKQYNLSKFEELPKSIQALSLLGWKVVDEDWIIGYEVNGEPVEFEDLLIREMEKEEMK